MLDGLTPDLAPRLVLAIGGVGVAFIVLIFVLLFLKRRNSPLFIKGGKAREPRLLILDAAAVDPKRRLVLIRRDDVEHLIMIGGPTDIVIETGISNRQPAVEKKAEPVIRDATPVTRSVAASIPDPIPEPRTMATPERRPEPAPQPVMRQPERSVQPEARPVLPEAKPAVAVAEARPVQPEFKPAPVQPEIKLAPVQPVVPLEALPGRIQPSSERDVSSMGSVLYDEDREPMTGVKPTPQIPSFESFERPVTQQQPVETSFARPSPILPQGQSNGRLPNQPAIAAPVERQEPAASPVTAVAAESALDQARARMLGAQPASAASVQAMSEADQARAIAARLEAARTDPGRRVQSAQPAAQYNASAVAQSQAQPGPVAARRERGQCRGPTLSRRRAKRFREAARGGAGRKRHFRRQQRAAGASRNARRHQRHRQRDGARGAFLTSDYRCHDGSFIGGRGRAPSRRNRRQQEVID